MLYNSTFFNFLRSIYWHRFFLKPILPNCCQFYCQFLFNISLFKYSVFLSDVLSGCSFPRFVRSIIFCLEHPRISAASAALITRCVTNFRKSAAVRGTFLPIRYNKESDTFIFTSHDTPYPPVCIWTCSKYSGFLSRIWKTCVFSKCFFKSHFLIIPSLKKTSKQ